MNKQYKQLTNTPTKGFTIIEVVLVLAIAGLIFLMVFIALPALQRGQRDTQRKQDLSRISTQLTNYTSSNRGAIPGDDSTSLCGFVTGYLGGSGCTAGDDYSDPSGSNYVIVPTPNTLAVGQIGYWAQANCGGSDAKTGITQKDVPARNYAITIRLENQTAPFCVDNRSS